MSDSRPSSCSSSWAIQKSLWPLCCSFFTCEGSGCSCSGLRPPSSSQGWASGASSAGDDWWCCSGGGGGVGGWWWWVCCCSWAERHLSSTGSERRETHRTTSQPCIWAWTPMEPCMRCDHDPVETNLTWGASAASSGDWSPDPSTEKSPLCTRILFFPQPRISRPPPPPAARWGKLSGTSSRTFSEEIRSFYTRVGTWWCESTDVTLRL